MDPGPSNIDIHSTIDANHNANPNITSQLASGDVMDMLDNIEAPSTMNTNSKSVEPLNDQEHEHADSKGAAEDSRGTEKHMDGEPNQITREERLELRKKAFYKKIRTNMDQGRLDFQTLYKPHEPPEGKRYGRRHREIYVQMIRHHPHDQIHTHVLHLLHQRSMQDGFAATTLQLGVFPVSYSIPVAFEERRWHEMLDGA